MKTLFVCACGRVHRRKDEEKFLVHCPGCGRNYLWLKDDSFPDQISNEEANRCNKEDQIPLVLDSGAPIMMSSGHPATFYDGMVFDFSEMEIQPDLFHLHDMAEDGMLRNLPDNLQNRARVDQFYLTHAFSEEERSELRSCVANYKPET